MAEVNVNQYGGNYNVNLDNLPPPPPGDKGKTNVGAGDFTPPGGDGAQGLGLPPPGSMSDSDLITLLQQIKTKIENEQLKTSSEDVQVAKDQKAVAAKERMEQLEKAIANAKKGDKGGLIGKIFGWIAAAAMVIAGAILLATGAGTALGVALLAGGIATMAVMTLQETGLDQKILGGLSKMFEAMGMDPEAARIMSTVLVAAVIITGAVVASVATGGAAIGPAIGVAATLMTPLISPENLQKMGVPEDAAPWVSLGLSIGLAVVAVSAGIGQSVAGAAKGGAQAAQLGSTVGAKSAATIAKATGATTEQIAKVGSALGYTAMGIQATATIGGGAAQISSAVAYRDAAEAEAKAKEFEKDMLKLQQLLQDESERIEEIIRRLQEGTDIVMDVLSQEDTTIKRIAAV
jgi:hypothetical protein